MAYFSCIPCIAELEAPVSDRLRGVSTRSAICDST
jgi:hypothetical protein